MQITSQSIIELFSANERIFRSLYVSLDQYRGLVNEMFCMISHLHPSESLLTKIKKLTLVDHQYESKQAEEMLKFFRFLSRKEINSGDLKTIQI